MKKYLLSFLAASTLLFSCDKSTTDTPQPEQKPDYAMLVITDLSNSSGLIFSSATKPAGNVDVSAVTTAQQIFNARDGAISFGKAIYVGANSAGDAGIQKYELDASGKMVGRGFISAASGDYNTKFHILSETLGFYSDRGAGDLKIQTFNPTTMARTGEIDLSGVSKKAQDSKIKFEIAGGRMLTSKEGKLYVDIHFATSDFGFGNSAYDAVHAAVIDVASKKYEKLISFEGAQEISYFPISLFMSEVDENGDLYINTMGNMLSDTRNGKILRIKKGQTEFDSSFQLSIDDYVSGPGIKWFHGGGVALGGKIVTGIKQNAFAPDYGNFNEENVVFHTIDVATKKATPINGVPKSDFVSLSTPYRVGSKVFIPYSNAKGSGLYLYENGQATEQFKVSGGVVMGFYQLGGAQ